MSDDFNGDNAHLIRSAQALLDLDADGALKPHGIGGHARGIISAFIARMQADRETLDMVREMDAVVHLLGIEDDFETPCEAIRKLQAVALDRSYVEKALQALDAYRFYIDAADFELEERGITRDQALAVARDLDPYDGVVPSEIAAREAAGT